jgi:hypothetical protein
MRVVRGNIFLLLLLQAAMTGADESAAGIRMSQLRQGIQRNLKSKSKKGKSNESKSSKGPMATRMSTGMHMGMRMVPSDTTTGMMRGPSNQNGGGARTGALTNSLITRAAVEPAKMGMMSMMGGANGEDRVGSLFTRIP